MTDPVRVMVARWRFDDITADEAVEIAKHLVDAGKASPALFDLSISEPDRVGELEPFMPRIAKEHGLDTMTDAEARRIAIEPIVASVADGQIDPFDGGYRIWLYTDMSFEGLPPDLADLVHDALQDHVQGEEREVLRREMIATARRYLEREVERE